MVLDQMMQCEQKNIHKSAELLNQLNSLPDHKKDHVNQGMNDDAI
jgi:hypothetical protein